MPTFTAIAGIIGSDWATPEAIEEKRAELLEAGAVDPLLERGDYVVDIRFTLEASDETDAQDVAHRVMTRAATTSGWMVTEIRPEGKEGGSQGDEGSRPVEQGPDA